MAGMRTEALSELFENGGLLVQPTSAGQRPTELAHDECVRLFEAHGVLLFRGFDLRPERLTEFIDRFTQTYAVDLATRAQRFDQAPVRDVDRGGDAIALHSEAGFAVTCPELIWFYCHAPSTTGGTTTLCDGITLWQRLCPETRRTFLAQPVRYSFSFGFGNKQPGQGRVPWPLPGIGVDGHVDLDEGRASLTVLRHAVQESRLASTTLCFANFLLPSTALIERSLADGRPLPEAVMNDVQQAADAVTFDLQWQAGDLLMLDNRRFMHGRRAFDVARDTRDIVQIQTAHASFAYGVTTRHQRVAEATAAQG